MAPPRKFNSLASWRNAENSLHSINLTMPYRRHRLLPVVLPLVQHRAQAHQQQLSSQNYRSCSGPPWTLRQGNRVRLNLTMPYRRHAGIAMLTPDDVHHHRAPDVLADARTYPASRLGPSPRTLRPRHPETRPASRSRLDQPTRHFHNRRNESVNRNRRCLKVVDRFRKSP